MPRFPENKNDILILARNVSRGIVDNPMDYPNPPFDSGPLSTFLAETIDLINQRQFKEAEITALIQQENEKVAQVTEELRRVIHLAEAIHRHDAPKLEEIDWDVRAKPKHLAPGQARNLEASHEGAGIVTLTWKAPARNATTGRPAAYKITREIRSIDEPHGVIEERGTWDTVSFKTKTNLINQPRGVEILYSVIASNKNGDGHAARTQYVVL